MLNYEEWFYEGMFKKSGVSPVFRRKPRGDVMFVLPVIKPILAFFGFRTLSR